MWLLDTMVVSELRKKAPDAAVVSWLTSVPQERLYLGICKIIT